MTEPTLDEQIAVVESLIGQFEGLSDRYAPKHRAALSAIIATLQRHKRTLAVVEAVRKWQDETAFRLPPEAPPPSGWVKEELERRKTAGRHLRDALAAFDAADTGEDGR